MKESAEIREKIPTRIKVEDILPEENELHMLIENKQIGLSIENQKAAVDHVLEQLKNDQPINHEMLLQISENQASELSALGNIVIRSSPYGAPIAYELYKAAMENGDDRGAFSYASMAHRGYRGIPKDEETGIKVFSELARKGHPYAQINLASILMRTQANQIPAAIKLYELAAKGGIDNAYVELGRMYRIGYGVHQDHKKAMDYFQQGAQKGNAQCMFMLGVYYSSNQIGKEDQKKAFKHFQKAAMRGMPEAQYNVGLRFLKGHGVETNAFNAAEFFKMAALQGFQLAQANLATMYMQGHGVKQDLAQARHWFEMVVAKGGSIGKEAQKSLDELNGKKSDGSRCSIM
ncbi:hypothetical protein BDA99DRAFT_19372 [Phascolomyces articulosus]|uniref:Uncharacterized protein n=1 Tax=Phascolomyces articulosus TaxID=60185 RepID=A0AAD5KDL0_9FUNG|nr:hypothetical protein BDA99DRAFT_19372 [Phascolomyces articulosus]